MVRILIENLAKPLIERIGTVFATFLIATFDLDAAAVEQLVSALSVVLLLSVDLFVSRKVREAQAAQLLASMPKRRRRKAPQEAQ